MPGVSQSSSSPRQGMTTVASHRAAASRRASSGVRSTAVATPVDLHSAPRLGCTRCLHRLISSAPRRSCLLRADAITRGEPPAVMPRVRRRTGVRSPSRRRPPSGHVDRRQSRARRVGRHGRLDLSVAAHRVFPVRASRPSLARRNAGRTHLPGDRHREVRAPTRWPRQPSEACHGFHPVTTSAPHAACHGRSHRRMHGDGITLARDPCDSSHHHGRTDVESHPASAPRACHRMAPMP
jgi:hypothetical protein